MNTSARIFVATAIGALIIAGGIVLAVLFAAPRYAITSTGSGVAYRLDVYSGAIAVCVADRCKPTQTGGEPPEGFKLDSRP